MALEFEEHKSDQCPKDGRSSYTLAWDGVQYLRQLPQKFCVYVCVCVCVCVSERERERESEKEKREEASLSEMSENGNWTTFLPFPAAMNVRLSGQAIFTWLVF